MDLLKPKKNDFIMSLEDRSAEFDAEEQQIMKGVELLYTDKLNEAEDFFDELKPHHARFSLHHAWVAAYVALMSSDEDDVERAITLLSETEALASQQAQKYSTHSNIKKVNEAVSSLKSWALGKMAKKGIAVSAARKDAEEQENKAEEALHELVQLHRARRARLWALQIQAECYLLTSLLQIVGAGESWTSMVKLGYNLKKTASIYQHCEKKLRKLNKEWIKMGGSFKVPEDLEDTDDSDSDSEDEERPPSKSKSSGFSKNRSLAEKMADLDMEGSSSSGDRIDSTRLDIKQLDALRDDQRMVLDSRKGVQEDYELSSIRIGLEFGIGAFNLIVSLIPANLQKATEMMGLPGDRNKGIRLLQKASATNHPRAPMAFVLLVQYHTVIMGLLPYGDHHAKEAKQLIDKVQPQWKNGSIFRIMLSRYERYEGMLSKALETLVKNSKTDPYDISNRGCNQRLRNFMIDELGWCFLLQGEFEKAADQFGKLFKDTVWFKPFYASLQASCLWEARGKCHQAASSVMRELPMLVSSKKQTGPLEQYGLRMANEFIASNQAPLFPALELAAVYNGFQRMDKPSLERHMDAVEDVQKNGGASKSGEGTSKAGGHEDFEIKWNNSSKLLCKFLMGHIHKALGDKQKAQECFRHVVKNAENITGNFVPYSCYELAAILLQDDVNSQEGLSLLDKAVAYPAHEFQPRLRFIVSEMTKIYKPLNK